MMLVEERESRADDHRWSLASRFLLSSTLNTEMFALEMRNSHIEGVQSDPEELLRRATPLNQSILRATPKQPDQINAEDCTEIRNSPCRLLP
jgi:hypothetical protein